MLLLCTSLLRSFWSTWNTTPRNLINCTCVYLQVHVSGHKHFSSNKTRPFLLLYKIIWTEGNRLSLKTFRKKKHRRRSSSQAIRQHPPAVLHPSGPRPRHHVLIAGKRRNALPIKTARKYSTYRLRFAALGKLVQISRKCLRRKRFVAVVNEFVPLLSHIFSLKRTRSSLLCARVHPRHLRTDSPKSD